MGLVLIVINGVGVMCVSHAKATHLDPLIISLAEGQRIWYTCHVLATCSPHFRTCHTFIVVCIIKKATAHNYWFSGLKLRMYE